MSDRWIKPGDWSAYFDVVRGQPARETLMRALDLFDRERPIDARNVDGGPVPLAVDLACGSGRDTVELLRRGWRVIAIDADQTGLDELAKAVPPEARSRLELVRATLEGGRWPQCDLLNASFAIPHVAPPDFPPLWERIVCSIRARGRFAGQFFGVHDDWTRINDGIARTFHTRAEVEEMLRPFEVEFLDEVDRPGKDSFGNPKHWHVFHVVARRRA